MGVTYGKVKTPQELYHEREMESIRQYREEQARREAARAMPQPVADPRPAAATAPLPTPTQREMARRAAAKKLGAVAPKTRRALRDRHLAIEDRMRDAGA